jgi:hypothetical protein
MELSRFGLFPIRVFDSDHGIDPLRDFPSGHDSDRFTGPDRGIEGCSGMHYADDRENDGPSLRRS